MFVSKKLNCNAGSRIRNLVSEQRGYGTVWFDPNGISNILSFKRVIKKNVVWYNENKQMFVVTKPDGKVFVFKESPSVLHYLNIKGDSGTTLANTVASQRSNY